MLPEPVEVAGAVAGLDPGVLVVGLATSPLVVCCVRWTTTFGAPTGSLDASVVVGPLDGAAVGAVVVVVVVVLVGSLAGVVAGVVGVVVVVPGVVAVPVGMVLVVVVCVGASDAGVVDVPEDGVVPVDGSVASAVTASGPPNPTAVNPPPASTETIARRTPKGTSVLERAPFTPDMLGPCSSLCGPVVAVEQGAARGRRPLDRIHIGRKPHVGKGFVIGAVTWP